MYIDSIRLKRFRTFQDAHVQFCHTGADYAALRLPAPRLPNVNLILGNNGSGKTTLLKGIALAALGPAVGSAGIYPYRLVRDGASLADVEARFVAHAQDRSPAPIIESKFVVEKKGDLESFRWTHTEEKHWHPIYQSKNDAFFFVGYGATRRVESKRNLDFAARGATQFTRAARVQGLFEDSYSLIPLNSWLPNWKSKNPGRYTQVVDLLNGLTGKEHFRFTGERNRDGEYLYARGGLKVPFPALSDGYRAYLGWIGDLLYHVCFTTPSGKKLEDNQGLVMVDEIDLHLHPSWQMSVLERLAKTLKNLQFIVTSHSPLVVGSLEWMNIIVMKAGAGQSCKAIRVPSPVHGLDADQILLTGFFGLKSTRAARKQQALGVLAKKARTGDLDAAEKLLASMGAGEEPAR